MATDSHIPALLNQQVRIMHSFNNNRSYRLPTQRPLGRITVAQLKTLMPVKLDQVLAQWKSKIPTEPFFFPKQLATMLAAIAAKLKCYMAIAWCNPPKQDNGNQGPSAIFLDVLNESLSGDTHCEGLFVRVVHSVFIISSLKL